MAHDWRNSILVNKKGTLDSVLECEDCGARQYMDTEDRLEHLHYLPTERYNNLKKLFDPKP